MVSVNYTIIAQIVNFIILLWILAKFAYKPLLKAMDDRRNRIVKDLDSAEHARKEAETLKLEYANQLKPAISLLRLTLMPRSSMTRLWPKHKRNGMLSLKAAASGWKLKRKRPFLMCVNRLLPSVQKLPAASCRQNLPVRKTRRLWPVRRMRLSKVAEKKEAPHCGGLLFVVITAIFVTMASGDA